MNNFIIFGPPLSGKGTVCKALAEEFGFEHVSTGDMLRAEQAAGTKLGKMADRLINAGGFVPDEVIIPIVKEHIIQSKNHVGIIFDGFPRTKEQAKQLHAFLVQRKSPVRSVIYLDVDRQQIMDRLKTRAVSESRVDDTDEVMLRRLNEYDTKTHPLVDFFEKKNLLIRIQANDGKDIVRERVFGTVRGLMQITA